MKKLFVCISIICFCNSASATFTEIGKAVNDGELETVQALVTAHPDLVNQNLYCSEIFPILIHAIDYYGFHESLKSKHSDTFYKIVMFLFNHKSIDLNKSDDEDDTPLHYLVKYHLPKLVIIMLQKGVNLNAQNKELKTPLHKAVMCQKPDIVEVLLAYGARTNIKDKDNHTPEELISLHPDYSPNIAREIKALFRVHKFQNTLQQNHNFTDMLIIYSK